jgi:Flp pilus assembly protein TadG
MQAVRNERGSVIVFVTLIIVVLAIMVGLGLDTGQLSYVRNQGQAAVDAAALVAVSGLPSRNDTLVKNRAAAFVSTNDYVESPTNKIGSGNVSYVQYDFSTNAITNYSADVNNANGVRVALEQANGGGITTPVFLTPLMNLLGLSTSGTKDVNVSAVSVITTKPAIPIAVWSSACNGGTTVPDVKLKQQHPSQNDGTENSCWTTFLDNSSGSSDVKALFKVAADCSGTPIDGEVDIGTPIYENKGQQASDYGVAEQFFFTDYPNRCWYVPVINGTGNCDAKNPAKITDWAKICPTSAVKNGAHSYIQVDLTCNQNINQDLSASNCFSHKLVRETKSGM